MAKIAVICFDNALSSQNQDYLPSRFVLQKEVIDRVITAALEDDRESLIGLIPLAQAVTNGILTPTKHRPYLSNFLYSSDLQRTPNIALSMYQAEQSLQNVELSDKTLVLFFSHTIEQVDELLSMLYSLASRGIKIKAVCFGECVDLGDMLKGAIDLPNFECISVKPEQDFNSVVLDFLGGGQSSADPELEEAIRRSLQEQ